MDFGTPQQGPWDWSRDGKFLLVRKESELWYMTMPDRQPRPLVQSQWLIRNAQFSPDEKFVAYSSSETGNWEVYVSPFPGFASKWQVSRGGGEEPRWRSDGKELFYLAPDGMLMAAEIKTNAGFEAGSPSALFRTHPRQPISAMDFLIWEVCAKGRSSKLRTNIRGVRVTRVMQDFYDSDPKRGFFGGGGIDTRFDFYPISFVLNGLPPDAPRWGASFKNTLMRNFNRTMTVISHTTCLALESNSISLDPEVKDAWGLPAMRITYKSHLDDFSILKFFSERSLELLDAAGAIKKWAVPIGDATSAGTSDGYMPHGE